MGANRAQRRVLLAAAEEVHEYLRDTFARGPLASWELHHTASIERARFLVQLGVWDAVLADESLFPRPAREGLAWLAMHQHVPVVYLGRADGDAIAQVLTAGVAQWLPRDVVLEYPGVLAAALNGLAERTRPAAPTSTDPAPLVECRRQVDRLLDLLWLAAPRASRAPWFSQSHMMERLQEEVQRVQRYGNTVSIALGEVLPESGEAEPGRTHLAEWVADQVNRAKRRPDVAGQYGPNGFMLLLVQTPRNGAVEFCLRLATVLQHGPAPVPGRVHAYFGIAGRSQDARDPKRLLRRAEEHLERAKAAREGQVVA